MAKIKDICEILDFKRVPITASDRKSGIYPYYGANGIQDHVDDYIFDDELVLLAEDGGYFGSSERPIAYRVSGKCWVNNHAHVLKPKDVVDVDYLCYSLMFRDVSSIVNGATRQKLTQADMKEIDIPVPLLIEQHAIVQILNKVFGLISLRKQQLSKLDELVKSRFIEMFDGKYATKPLHDVCEELFAGGDVKKDKTSDAQSDEYPYPIYTNGEKDNGLYGYTSLVRVTKEAVTISGRGTIGFTCLRKEPFYPAVRLIVAVPKQDLVSGCYLQHFIQSKNYGGQGASIPQLTVPMIKDELIPVPPIDLQNEFASFVEQTDKSKFEIQKSLEKLETLKKALMQKYFG